MNIAKNMKLLAHHPLDGFGNIGEGMALQKTREKRRVLWLAHESAPKNFTAVDVTNPKKPAVIVQTDLPHERMRSNSLDLVGDLLVVAYQTREPGMKPAGFEMFDVSDPSEPRSVTFFDCSGPMSRGVHHLWWVDGEYLHMAAGAADFRPRNQKDDQCYRIVDVKNPTQPAEVGRWWLPGTQEGDATPALPRHPQFDTGYRAHNTNVYPQRLDRAYVGYIDGGACVLDISDECTKTAGQDWPKMIWIVDARREDKLVPLSTCPAPPLKQFKNKGNGRYGAHNLHENRPGHWYSEDLILGTFFNGGLRVFDVKNPFEPKEVAWFVPPAPKKSPAKAIQINDVLVDEKRIVYTVDRVIGGLYILEMKV